MLHIIKRTKNAKPDVSLLYNIHELQEILCVGRNLAYRFAHKRNFPKIIINGHYFFPKEPVRKVGRAERRKEFESIITFRDYP